MVYAGTPYAGLAAVLVDAPPVGPPPDPPPPPPPPAQVTPDLVRDYHELTVTERRKYEAALTRHHSVRVRLVVMDLNHNHLTQLDATMVDGQINVDDSAEVSRSATLTLFDPDHNLHFDSDSPSDGALYLDRMIRILYSVWVSDLGVRGGWVEVPVFCGPIVKLDRDVDVINVECRGKEELARSECWRPLTLNRGMRKVRAIRTILTERAGETRFDLPDLSTRLPNPVSLARMSIPWKEVRKIARGMDRHLFYTAGGLCRLRAWPANVTWTFGPRALTSEPSLSYSSDAVKNVVWVKGGKPAGVRKRFDPIPDDPDTPNRDESKSVSEQVAKVPDVQASVVAPRSHPLSPWRIGREGAPRFMVDVVENDRIRSSAEADTVARQRLADLLEQSLDVSFDSLPIPHLEPGDRVRVQTGEWTMAFRLRQFSLPLLVGDGAAMSVGYHARVSARRRRLRLRDLRRDRTRRDFWND